MSDSPSSPALSAIVESVDGWLAQNFHKRFDLAALARHVGYEKCYISHVYRRQGGTTITLRIRQLRITAAAKMLDEGSSVADAARAVGYASLSHFTKAFVAEKGMRPTAWMHTPPSLR